MGWESDKAVFESDFIVCIFSHIAGYRVEAKLQYMAKDSLLEAKECNKSKREMVIGWISG